MPKTSGRAASIIACFAFPIDPRDIVVKPLIPFDLVVVSRRNHPAIKQPLDLETFRSLPQIAVGRELRGLTGVDKSLVAQGTQRHTPYMAAKIWSMPPMIQRTDLIGLLPRRFARDGSPACPRRASRAFAWYGVARAASRRA